MTSTSALRHAAAAFCAAVLCTTGAARAETFALGTVNGPDTFTFESITRTGPFEDTFTFSIAPGAALSFSAFLNTPFSNRFWIPDLDGRLERGGLTLAEGDSREVLLPPFPRQEVTFAPLALGAGDYTLHVSGTPVSAWPGPTASYDGTFTFAAVAAPVPEPATVGLMTLGLALVAMAVRWRAG